MDNFQHNWPPFWGYIFYFLLTPVAHLVFAPHTASNLYGHLLPWQREAIPWLFYYLSGVRSTLHQALVPECVPCHWRPLHLCTIWSCLSLEFIFLFLSAFYLVFVRLCKDIKEKQYLPWEKRWLHSSYGIQFSNNNDIIVPWTIVSLIWRGWPLIVI